MKRKPSNIAAPEAYGERVDELVLELGPRNKLAPGMDPKWVIKSKCSPATDVCSIRCAVTDSTVTVDANHELAGKDLTFKIKILTYKQIGSNCQDLAAMLYVSERSFI
jgi:FKBP-type peptidyl-prolyl cis-trans isomerase 2